MLQQEGQQAPRCAPEQPLPGQEQGFSSPGAQQAVQPPHPAGGAANVGAPQLAPGVVLHGTCGWSDASLVRCGRFYPASVKASSSSEEKLRHYR